MHEQIDMRGAVTLQLTDRSGAVIHEQRRRNRIVRTGRELVAHFFAGQALAAGGKPQQITHIAVGTAEAEPKDEDTQLGEERFRKAIETPVFSFIQEAAADPAGAAITLNRVAVEVTAVLGYDDANDKKPLREAGIFTADKGGIMYNRVKFEPVIKTKDFQLTLRWTIVF